jgi:hypothetical protein
MMRSETSTQTTPEPEESIAPTPTQAESDAMVLAATGGAMPLGQPHIVPREGEDLTPAMTQTQNDVAMLVACGPPPGSQAPINIDVPYVGGSAMVGGTLTCTMGNWTGEPTSYAYQWKRDGTTDIGAGVAAYVPVTADAGHDISCVVTATNDNGSTAAPPSNAVTIAAARTSPR